MKRFSFIASGLPLLLSLGLSAHAAPTSCLTSTTTQVLPTVTITAVGETRTWKGKPMTEGRRVETVYTTEYDVFCSTGLRKQTYTITEHCPPQPDCPCRGDIPKNFYTTVAVCHTCGKHPVTATLTLPAVTAVPLGAPPHNHAHPTASPNSKHGSEGGADHEHGQGEDHGHSQGEDHGQDHGQDHGHEHSHDKGPESSGPHNAAHENGFDKGHHDDKPSAGSSNTNVAGNKDTNHHDDNNNKTNNNHSSNDNTNDNIHNNTPGANSSPGGDKQSTTSSNNKNSGASPNAPAGNNPASQPGHSDQPAQPGKPGQPDQPAQPNQPGKPEQPAQPGRPGATDRIETIVRPGASSVPGNDKPLDSPAPSKPVTVASANSWLRSSSIGWTVAGVGFVGTLLTL